MSEQVVKPGREPDFIDRHGSYYWFSELVYLSVFNSVWYNLEVHPEFDMLVRKVDRCKRCEGCLDKHVDLCVQQAISKEVDEARQKWISDSFESVFLGKNDE